MSVEQAVLMTGFYVYDGIKQYMLYHLHWSSVCSLSRCSAFLFVLLPPSLGWGSHVTPGYGIWSRLLVPSLWSLYHLSVFPRDAFHVEMPQLLAEPRNRCQNPTQKTSVATVSSFGQQTWETVEKSETNWLSWNCYGVNQVTACENKYKANKYYFIGHLSRSQHASVHVRNPCPHISYRRNVKNKNHMKIIKHQKIVRGSDFSILKFKEWHNFLLLIAWLPTGYHGHTIIGHFGLSCHPDVHESGLQEEAGIKTHSEKKEHANSIEP